MSEKAIGDFIPERNNLGHYKIYILKHKDKKFKGLVCGIGFENGIGSTSSYHDAQTILNLKRNDATKARLDIVTDITEEYWNEKIEARKKADERKTSKETKAKEEDSKDKEA